jgi:hypothetical protein
VFLYYFITQLFFYHKLIFFLIKKADEIWNMRLEKGVVIFFCLFLIKIWYSETTHLNGCHVFKWLLLFSLCLIKNWLRVCTSTMCWFCARTSTFIRTFILEPLHLYMKKKQYPKYKRISVRSVFGLRQS